MVKAGSKYSLLCGHCHGNGCTNFETPEVAIDEQKTEETESCGEHEYYDISEGEDDTDEE